MQVESNQAVCPTCGAEGLHRFPVFHHMICAYVGPVYDFGMEIDGYSCPKCRRSIMPNDAACEIVGTSARCPRCRREMVVSPATKTSNTQLE
ncbi:hypothetical protein JQ581_25860 [Bradyrhizobium liaoningense]|nr:hypothetical protein [Bradyrhizobium liaoningense]